MIYLDNAATTKDTTTLSYKSEWSGNPHSIHQIGRRARTSLDEATNDIKDYINGHDGEFFWIGSGSQANSLAINTVCESSTLLTSAIEHKSILQHAQCYVYDVLKPTTWGFISDTDVDFALANSTDLVSIQYINNETGVINPIQSIARMAHERGAYMHTDAVQAFGKYPIDVEELDVDMLTISAHKAHGPKGLGGLWVRNNVLNDKERGNFPYIGTPPVELVDRLVCAIDHIDIIKNSRQVQKLENMFLSILIGQRVEHVFTVRPKHRIPGLISLHFPNVDADDLVLELSDKGVMVSSGSACDNGKVDPSHVLLAMNISPKQARETIRVSLSHLNTFDEVQEAALIMADIIERIKNGSQSTED